MSSLSDQRSSIIAPTRAMQEDDGDNIRYVKHVPCSPLRSDKIYDRANKAVPCSACNQVCLSTLDSADNVTACRCRHAFTRTISWPGPIWPSMLCLECDNHHRANNQLIALHSHSPSPFTSAAMFILASIHASLSRPQLSLQACLYPFKLLFELCCVCALYFLNGVHHGRRYAQVHSSNHVPSRAMNINQHLAAIVTFFTATLPRYLWSSLSTTTIITVIMQTRATNDRRNLIETYVLNYIRCGSFHSIFPTFSFSWIFTSFSFINFHHKKTRKKETKLSDKIRLPKCPQVSTVFVIVLMALAPTGKFGCSQISKSCD